MCFMRCKAPIRLFWPVLLLLAACGGVGRDSDVIGVPGIQAGPAEPLVQITHPPSTAIIYAEALYVAGRLSSAPQRFNLQLLTTDDQIIYETTLESEAAIWEAELLHGYIGPPEEILIRVLPQRTPAQPNTQSETEDEGGAVVVPVVPYDEVVILLSNMRQRPEGAYGGITQPANGTQTGGDMILVMGRASGVAQNSITLEFIGDDDRVIDVQTVNLTNPYFVDDIPWEQGIATNGYIGQASIRMVVEAESGGTTLLDSVLVTVTQAAG